MNLKRTLYELMMGKKAYLPKKKKPKTKKTIRTKTIESGLKSAGLSEEDIKRLRGK